MDEFKITVKNQSKIEVIKSNEIHLDGDVRYGYFEKINIKMFQNWLKLNRIENKDEFAVFGTHLFNVLFDNKIKKAFKEEYEGIGKNNRLRVVLEFLDDAGDLAVLPWEYLYYPDSEEGEGFFIATDSQLVLMRHVPLTFKGKRYPKPLRILIVVSKPSKDIDGRGLKIINAKDVIDSIKELEKSIPIQVKELSQPTKNSLMKFLDKQESPFHVVHFISHGKYDKDEEVGQLALVDAKDPQKAAWIKDEAIAECFKGHEPRLIFLHACEGAETTSYDAFRGIALKLVYSRIPGVVAMRYEITNSVATKFTNKFYKSLGEGNDIDIAVQEGRTELGLYLDEEKVYCNRAFGTPVVYLKSAEGIVIAESTETDKPIDIEDKNISLVSCPNVRGGCTSKVFPTDSKCVDCKHELMLCPKCKKVMSKTKGTCGCGYELKPSKAETKLGSTKDPLKIQGKKTIDLEEGVPRTRVAKSESGKIQGSTQARIQAAGSPGMAGSKR